MQAGTTYNATAKQISSPGFLVIGQAGPSLTRSTAPATAATSLTSTPSSSSTFKSPSTPAAPSGLSTAAKAGISVGATVMGILILALLGLLIALFVEDRQKRLLRGNIADAGSGSKITDSDTSPSLAAHETGTSQATPAHYPVPAELDGTAGRC
jgi:hypothetical protein